MARFFRRPRALGQQTRPGVGSGSRNSLLLREQADVGQQDCSVQYPGNDPASYRARRACEGSLSQEIESKNNVVRYLLVWGIVGIAIIGIIIYLLVR